MSNYRQVGNQYRNDKYVNEEINGMISKLVTRKIWKTSAWVYF
jgi:hypothetical protein